MWRPPDRYSYAYLLGIYLGDGCVSTKPRGGAQLQVACDAGYPELTESCRAAIVLTSVGGHITQSRREGENCVRITCAWKRWPEVFPQHGPGRKHERRIALEPWQQAIVDEHPWQFLSGLLHSDGCRTINRFKTKLPSGRLAEYAYARWFFSNRSEDILGSSAPRASSSACAGPARTTAMSRCRIAPASRCWTPTSA